MDPMTLALILGGTGVVKGLTVDKWKEDRQRELAASTQRYSPWTGLQAGAIEEADPLGQGIQGGLQGAAFGQNMQNAAAAKGLAAKVPVDADGVSNSLAPTKANVAAMQAKENSSNVFGDPSQIPYNQNMWQNMRLYNR